MFDQGTVVKLDGTNAHILIKTGDQCKTCGARVLCSPESDKERIIIADNSIGAAIHDEVTIEETGSITLILSALQYGLPFLGFILGIVAAYLFYTDMGSVPKEIVQFTGGLIGIIILGSVSRYYMKKMSKNVGKYLAVKEIIS